jgi:2-succinyl-5-enolpyruvyl-6-hydroxy-3-cyclohexene-1-carboxylate synthase
MPVRDVETFFPPRDAPPRVLSNRGANGIDGTVSTAFGRGRRAARPPCCSPATSRSPTTSAACSRDPARARRSRSC